MAITLDGTNGITTPDLESSGPVTGTTGTFSGAVQASGVATNLYPLVSGTAVASTSGTSIDFTGIPSWVKRITVMFDGVSTSGTARVMVQLGDSGGVETTGYFSNSYFLQNYSSNANLKVTTGFVIYWDSVTGLRHGAMTISLVSAATNTWVSAHNIAVEDGTDGIATGAGRKSLSATLDQVRITTTNGTDTFDAGSINILYE